MIVSQTITKLKRFLVKIFFKGAESTAKGAMYYMRPKDSQYLMNIIILEASDLLYLIALLRQNKIDKLIDKTYHSILETIESFITSLEKYNFSTEQISQAKYLICAALDEAAANGKNSSLALEITNKGFINYFYKEGLGGEKFFRIIDSLSEDISRNYSLIRLAYILLLLGFKGKYGIIEEGLSILKDIQNQLYLSISHYEKYVLTENFVSVNQQNTGILLQPAKLCMTYIFLTFITYGIFSTILDSRSKPLIGSLITQLDTTK